MPSTLPEGLPEHVFDFKYELTPLRTQTPERMRLWLDAEAAVREAFDVRRIEEARISHADLRTIGVPVPTQVSCFELDLARIIEEHRQGAEPPQPDSINSDEDGIRMLAALERLVRELGILGDFRVSLSGRPSRLAIQEGCEHPNDLGRRRIRPLLDEERDPDVEREWDELEAACRALEAQHGICSIAVRIGTPHPKAGVPEIDRVVAALEAIAKRRRIKYAVEAVMLDEHAYDDVVVVHDLTFFRGYARPR